ncbi:hypothetical protein OIU34_23165 [Pararhizobium sp. BT-229]|uniref:hypothetical protein n=1 Tax=Pararhizobium sp. BT-229 TaxID=2986923 RepID=UPI0021F6DFB8|nr:hypothetical protein [Pararhizobium sp. BT-229]MCV9964796.1 hypothetical protein [Pararhizobium sp. BT-229]
MPVELTHQNVRDLTKKLRELTGRDIKSTAILAAIAEALGRRPDAMMHELKLEAASDTSRKDSPFEFPHDPRSNFDHISSMAVRKSALALISGYEDMLSDDPDIRTIIADKGGWMVPNVLRTAAAFAFMRGIDPRTDYDAALVMQGLANYGYPSTGAVALENKVPSPVSQARDLAEANGFKIWNAGGGTLVFGRMLKEVDLPGGDTATLDVMITTEGGTSLYAGPNDRVWFAGMNYQDPRGSETVAGGGEELSTLHEAITAAAVFRSQADRVWDENYDPDAIAAFLARRQPNLPKP